jgi:hypothetical protein
MRELPNVKCCHIADPIFVRHLGCWSTRPTMAFFGMAKVLRIKGLDTNNGENKNIVESC